jgi:hypothetical protein
MLSKIYTVFCDAHSCGRWVGQENYATESRRLARQKGWKRVPRPGGPDGRGVDYCPVHAHLAAEQGEGGTR